MSIRLNKKSFINSTCCLCMLGLLFMAIPNPANAGQKKHASKKKGVVQSMTVLEVGAPVNDEPSIRIIFRVSQRIYKLPKDANPKYLDLLKESAQKHTPVLVRRAKEESDVILSVEKP